jgi:hypothetical protein
MSEASGMCQWSHFTASPNCPTPRNTYVRFPLPPSPTRSLMFRPRPPFRAVAPLPGSQHRGRRKTPLSRSLRHDTIHSLRRPQRGGAQIEPLIQSFRTAAIGCEDGPMDHRPVEADHPRTDARGRLADPEHDTQLPVQVAFSTDVRVCRSPPGAFACASRSSCIGPDRSCDPDGSVGDRPAGRRPAPSRRGDPGRHPGGRCPARRPRSGRTRPPPPPGSPATWPAPAATNPSSATPSTASSESA